MLTLRSGSSIKEAGLSTVMKLGTVEPMMSQRPRRRPTPITVRKAWRLKTAAKISKKINQTTKV